MCTLLTVPVSGPCHKSDIDIISQVVSPGQANSKKTTFCCFRVRCPKKLLSTNQILRLLRRASKHRRPKAKFAQSGSFWLPNGALLAKNEPFWLQDGASWLPDKPFFAKHEPFWLPNETFFVPIKPFWLPNGSTFPVRLRFRGTWGVGPFCGFSG